MAFELIGQSMSFKFIASSVHYIMFSWYFKKVRTEICHKCSFTESGKIIDKKIL